MNYKLVAAGQLVVNRLQANNGLIFCSALDGVVSPDYSVFDGKLPIQMRYLSDLLRTSQFRTHFRRESTGLGTGTAGFLRLYDDDLLATPVGLPPFAEQTCVVDHVDRLTAEIGTARENIVRQIQSLRDYRTRLIANVVTGKLDVREAASRLRDDDPSEHDGMVDGNDVSRAVPDLDEPETGSLATTEA